MYKKLKEASGYSISATNGNGHDRNLTLGIHQRDTIIRRLP